VTMQSKIYGPPLQDYIRYKLGWTREQINGTNWAAVHGTLMSYPLQGRTTRMKAIYGWLHTHQRKARIYSTTPTCPLCNAIDTNDHVLICSATVVNRLEAVNQFMTSIGEKTPLAVNMVLQQRLREALDLSPMAHQPEDIAHHLEDTGQDDFILAVEQQDDLGWINFIRGRHSIKWEEAYDVYLQSLKGKPPCRSGRQWATQLVKASLTLLVEIWYGRNDQYHNQEEADGTPTPRTRELHDRIRETYEDRYLYSTAVQEKLFDIPMEKRMQQRQFQLVKWLQTVDNYYKASKGVDQAPIHSYFHPTRPQDNTGPIKANQ